MNNKPVAWIAVGDNTSVFFDLDCALAIDDNPTPLYTHPVNPKYDPETGEPLIDGYPLFSGLPHPVKELTDEEMAIIKEAVGNYVCTIKMEIDQEKQTFKGYEHCSNLPSLESELKDAEKAIEILRKAQNG